MGTSLAALSPPSLLLGPHWSWGELQYSPLPSPQPAGGKSLPDPLFSLLPESKGGGAGSLLSACAPGVRLAQERGHSSVDICSGSDPTGSLGTLVQPGSRHWSGRVEGRASPLHSPRSRHLSPLLRAGEGQIGAMQPASRIPHLPEGRFREAQLLPSVTWSGHIPRWRMEA